MNHKFLRKSNKKQEQGFTLIELVVVMAGLGLLSSLAIPNYLKYLDYAKVDQAKSMLNSAAADCLQGLRNEGTSRLGKITDEAILSNELMESISYEFKADLKNCGSVLITTTDSTTPQRLPDLGFSISESGKVSKQAVDAGGETTAPAKSWAGSNTSSVEGLEDFLNYNALIAAAQATCKENLDNWLKSTGDGKTYSWNSSATSGCPSNPPKVESATCTTNGCNAPYYALDGTKVGTTADSYDAALAAKYGKICTEKTKAKRESTPPYTNPSSTSITITECGAKQFWFYEGEDAGSQVAWEKLFYKANNPTGKQTLSDGSGLYLCLGEEKATEALMTQCINDNEEAGCDNQINEKIASNFDGEFVAKSGGPGSCSSVNWMCDGRNYKTDKSAYEEACDSCGPLPIFYCEYNGMRTEPECISWNECMGYL